MRRRALLGVWLLLTVCISLAAQGAPCSPASEGSSPMVIVALDGVPYSVVEQARRGGAFEDWPKTRPLISTFPSMTNVAFAAIFAPLGVEPIAGYEIPHFDLDRMRMVGKSPFGARHRSYGWRSVIDKELLGIWSHTVAYAAPRRRARSELTQVEEKVLAVDRDLLVVYIAATDALTHFRGHDGLLRYLSELEQRLDALQREYRRRHGGCLRLVLLSDHGNTEVKVRRVQGLRSRLRQAGFNLGSRLRRENDAVAPTFGLCNYGAIYVQKGRIEAAAQAIASHPNVELAISRPDGDRIVVLSREDRAEVSWRTEGGEMWFRYQALAGDPLELAPAVDRLRAAKALNEDQYASRSDWLTSSADARYPNALERIVEAFTGAHVRHLASVLFSIEPGYAWGRRAGYIGASLKGGRLEGTHGGLDAVSSNGFLLVNDPSLDPGRAVGASEALSFLPSGSQVTAASGDRP